MIIVVGGIKGGSGKTTIATNLAVCAANRRKKVLLVDADEQRSCMDWAEQRELTINRLPKQVWASVTTISLTGRAIHQTLKKMVTDYDVCIVDAGGRDTTSQRAALIVADIAVLPFKPRSLDVWTLCKDKEMISEIKTINPTLRTYALINQGDIKGSDNDDVIEVILEQDLIDPLTVIIKNRKAFANAASFGLGVIELDKKDKDRKAVEEINALHDFMLA